MPSTQSPKQVCHVFFVSDGTGITAETLGHSLLAQFPDITFMCTTFPYINSIEKAEQTVMAIQEVCQNSPLHIVMSTLVNETIRGIISRVPSRIVDLFAAFLGPIEEALHTHSAYTVGTSRTITSDRTYQNRINAIHFAMMNDDGNNPHHYRDADLILIGVSRSGKTPVCLYLALQFGVLTANYPMTEEDLMDEDLPTCLRAHRPKLFGLTIDPLRLHAIREERRSNSRYASLQQCQYEVSSTITIMSRYQIPYLDTTERSIEEIATKLLATAGIKRQVLIL